MLCHVALVRTDISEEYIASIFRVIGIGMLGTMLSLTSNWSMLRHYIPLKHQFLQEPHSITSQRMAFFTVY
jgi:hypothetical protein